MYHIVSQIYVPFDWTATGGAEEYHIQLAIQLAQRGFKVNSYTPLPPRAKSGGCRWHHDGVDWLDVKDINQNDPGIWIFQRDPSLVFLWEHPDRRDQYFCFAAHDVDYGEGWACHYDAILADSEYHAQWLRERHHHENVIATGVAPQFQWIDRVPEVERNPKRIMWSSSYTRGLDCAIGVYGRALEQVPDLEMYVAMGWESIDCRKEPSLDAYKASLIELMEKYHVHQLGRLPTSVDVWAEYAKSGIWLYPSMWMETGCQTAMEAQAFGAIPIWNPHWATIENCRHGIPILGDPYNDQLVRMRFVQELVNLAVNPELQEKIRAEMMPDARDRFRFSRVVDRIVEATVGKLKPDYAAR